MLIKKSEFYVVIIAIFVVLLIIILNFLSFIPNKMIIENSKSEQIINSNSLTMMYETEADSGEYQISSDTTWLQEGYTFNNSLSKCENGSVLMWDDENHRVMVQANTSDKCYVYFDKEPVKILNIDFMDTGYGFCIVNYSFDDTFDLANFYLTINGLENVESYLDGGLHCFSNLNLKYHSTYDYSIFAKDVNGDFTMVYNDNYIHIPQSGGGIN